MAEPRGPAVDTGAPSSSVAPLSTLVAPTTTAKPVGLREGASRTDWKDLVLALVSVGSILMLVAQLVGELPGTEIWQSVVGIVVPLVLLVLRRLAGHGPRALRSPTMTPARAGAALLLAAGLWWVWEAVSERSIVSGVLGVAALGVGAALDRHLRVGADDDASPDQRA